MPTRTAAEQEQQYRRIIANAVDSGRISPRGRGIWLNRLRKRPGATAATLLTLTPVNPSSETEPELPAWFN
ncbi:hypothetical protein GS433_15515 [Rhodococcus hoagii]|uniref:hypothetical protein n=1 Tax=Rhodococcus hoagii TaxID=43767 RepID=UPI0007CD80E5|nr:hypothetical protein [Prescottella equi]MBM4535799.1 hypothetical protein [Prescottella equi]NKR81603.1 hypothetical protein [Prescottella equi]ORL11051.1 hypothetical protein A6I84_03485 [Prescottella equi]